MTKLQSEISGGCICSDLVMFDSLCDTNQGEVCGRIVVVALLNQACHVLARFRSGLDSKKTKAVMRDGRVAETGDS
jgi:hypothetical protein